MSAQNGGPAFPVDTSVVGDAGASEYWHQTGHTTWQFGGMTLRDYFAAKAMVRLTGADPDGIHSAQTLAALSYRLADAMLAERSK